MHISRIVSLKVQTSSVYFTDSTVTNTFFDLLQCLLFVFGSVWSKSFPPICLCSFKISWVTVSLPKSVIFWGFTWPALLQGKNKIQSGHQWFHEVELLTLTIDPVWRGQKGPIFLWWSVQFCTFGRCIFQRFSDPIND